MVTASFPDDARPRVLRGTGSRLRGTRSPLRSRCAAGRPPGGRSQISPVPRPHENRPAPAVQGGKLVFKVGNLLADFGQLVASERAPVDGVGLAGGGRLISGLPVGKQGEEFFACPDGGHALQLA